MELNETLDNLFAINDTSDKSEVRSYFRLSIDNSVIITDFKTKKIKQSVSILYRNFIRDYFFIENLQSFLFSQHQKKLKIIFLNVQQLNNICFVYIRLHCDGSVN